MKDLWKLTLLKYREESDWTQRRDKDIIISAFRDMVLRVHHSMWKNYINGLIIFPEMTDIIIEYIDRSGMAFKVTGSLPISKGTLFRVRE